MELHRSWKRYLAGPIWVAGGIGLLLAPTLILPLIRYEFGLGNWVAYPLGVVSVLLGGLLLFDASYPFLLRIDDNGVAWQVRGFRAAVPWHSVVRLAIEKEPDDPPKAEPATLTLWLREPVRSAGPPDVTVAGLVGYHLVDVGRLAESVAEINEGLRPYADGAHVRHLGSSPGNGPAPALERLTDAYAGRPPAEGECAVCGSTPAAFATVHSMLNVVIFHWTTTRRGWWCRDCALATYRDFTDTTLIGCWWGIGVLGTPIILAISRYRVRAALRLGPPRPTSDVAAPAAAPLDPGRPVRKRLGGMVAAVMLGLAAVGTAVFGALSLMW